VNEIEKALDLSTWGEQRGFTSTIAPKCPTCGAFFDPIQHCYPGGKAVCPKCKRRCQWRIVETPLGQGWMTFVVIREQTP
jgi:hypothetical protein